MSNEESKKILIVEDNAVDQRVLFHKLVQLGKDYDIVCSDNVESGLAKLEGDQYDCVFLDHLLPDGNSFDFLQQAKEKGNMPPVVVTTCYGDELMVRDILLMGAADYIPKGKLTPQNIYQTLCNVTSAERQFLPLS